MPSEADLQAMIDRAVDKAITRAIEHAQPQLVEKVVDKVEQRFFANVGRRVVTQALKWIGTAAVAVAIYLYGAGVLKP